MITLCTKVSQSGSDLDILVATPNAGLITISAGSIGAIDKACRQALSEISAIAGVANLMVDVELGEADASGILKRISPLGENILGTKVLREIAGLIEAHGNGAVTVLTDTDRWLPWELMHGFSTGVAPTYTDFWGCKYRIYRRFPNNLYEEMESDPKIPVKHEHPQIAVVPLNSSAANALKIKAREIPYLQYLDKEHIARIQWSSVLNPSRWKSDFEYLCSWLNTDTSEIVHVAGLLDCPPATTATYQLVLGDDFTIPIHNNVSVQRIKTKQNDFRTKLRQDLTDLFSEEDLRTLCFDIKLDYESLPAQGKAGKAREIVAQVERNGTITKLIEQCRQLRPNVPWIGMSEIDNGVTTFPDDSTPERSLHNHKSTLADELNLRGTRRVLVLNVRCNGQRDPLRVLPVISVLLDVGAEGVIASVYPIPDVFAAAFIEKFYRRFLCGYEIGETLVQTKSLFVREFNNPLALLYSPFVNLQNPGLQLKVTDAKGVPEEPFSLAPQPGPRSSPPSHLQRKKVVILHLSDLHYGPEHRFSPKDFDKNLPHDEIPNLSTALIHDLKHQNASVDMLVISGDIAQSGEMEQFNWARGVIEDLINGLQLQMRQVIIVPGNHDIHWLKEEIKSLPYEPNGNYRTFHELLYKTRCFRDTKRLFHVTFIEEKNLAIVGLDSCVIEGVTTAGVGYVGDRQLNMAIEEMNKLTRGYSDCVKVAVLHHHLFPVQDYERIPLQDNQFSLVMDAASVLRRLYQEGFALILHGHQHQPYCVDLRLHEHGITRVTSMAIAGAGSAGAKRAELGNIARNHYNIIEIETSNRSIQIRVVGRMSSDRAIAEFEPYPKMTVTLNLGGSVGVLS